MRVVMAGTKVDRKENLAVTMQLKATDEHGAAETETRSPKPEGRPAALARQRGEKKSETRNPNQSK
jgi:hypothetical protein